MYIWSLGLQVVICRVQFRDLKKFTGKKIITEIDHHEAESRHEWMLSIFRRAGEGNGSNQMFQFWRQDNHPVELFSKRCS